MTLARCCCRLAIYYPKLVTDSPVSYGWRIPEEAAEIFEQTIASYMPEDKFKRVSDFLPEHLDRDMQAVLVIWEQKRLQTHQLEEHAIKYMEEDLIRIEQQIKDSELLLCTSNPLTRAEYFGVIFDKVPTYQEIKDGTQNASLIPDINQIFRLAFSNKDSMVGNEGLEPPTSSV
jgi:hypothetical protein